MKLTNSYILLRFLPNFLWPLKKIVLKTSLKAHGRNLKIAFDSQFVFPQLVTVGNDVFIGPGFYCAIIKPLSIGNRVMFGPRCAIIGGDHHYNNPADNMRFTKLLGDNREIIIEDDVWIGYGVLILKKAYIAEGCIIGANSLVNEKTKPYTVYAGNPLKEIKPRFKQLTDLLSYLAFMEEKYNFKSNYNLSSLEQIYR